MARWRAAAGRPRPPPVPTPLEENHSGPAMPRVVAARFGPCSSCDAEAAVHEPSVRIAEEAISALLQRERVALRALEGHAREDAVDARPAEVEVVDRRAVPDDEPVRRVGLQPSDLLSAQGERDRERWTDGSVDHLGCRCGRSDRRGGERRAGDQNRDPKGRRHVAPSSLLPCVHVLSHLFCQSFYELKLTFAEPQPTFSIQTFWSPSISGARSWSETITFTPLKDASFPSPAR